MLTLLPLALSELKQTKATLDAYDCIWRGSYPRLHQFDLKPDRFFNGSDRLQVDNVKIRNLLVDALEGV